MKTSNGKEMRTTNSDQNYWDLEKDTFEVHECPVCGMEDEFNMSYEKFLCRHCGKASTLDIRKLCAADSAEPIQP